MRGIACGARFTRIVKEVNSPGVFNPRMFNEPATSRGRNDIFCRRGLARRSARFPLIKNSRSTNREGTLAGGLA